MACFSTGPPPGTPEYEAWLPDVRRKLDAFIHVVDYYYGKTGMAMPEPAAHGDPDGPPGAGLDPAGNDRVLGQILMHLDCDGVDVFHLNDVRNLLREDQTPRGRAYLSVLGYCFRALRNGFRDRPTTGAMWEECRDPALMLDHLRGKASDRKLRLFAVACCRRVPHLLADERSQTAVEVAERFAEGIATVEELAAAGNQAQELGELQGYYGPVAVWAVVPSAEEAARYAAWNAFCDRNGMGEELIQAALLRCITGNPFHPVTANPAWLTPAAVGLARLMYESRDFAPMPILGDAMQDAGCGVAEVLEHCRGLGPHVRGCWVVDLILSKDRSSERL